MVEAQPGDGGAESDFQVDLTAADNAGSDGWQDDDSVEEVLVSGG